MVIDSPSDGLAYVLAVRVRAGTHQYDGRDDRVALADRSDDASPHVERALDVR